jgi:hypothetical protein
MQKDSVMLRLVLLSLLFVSISFATVSNNVKHISKNNIVSNNNNEETTLKSSDENTTTAVESNDTTNELSETFVKEANKVFKEVDKDLKEAVDVRSGYTTGLIQPKVGVYITSLDNFDTKNGSFDVIFWSWFIYDASKKYKSDMSTELTNMKDINILQNFSNKVEGNRIWNTRKVKATLSHDWDFSNYPFDTQKLTLQFEDGDYDYRDLRFIADVEGSKVAKGLQMEGWIIKNFTIKERKNVIDSNFGDPSLSVNQSVYSQLVATVEIERNWVREFINNFLAIYIAFFILALSYMFKDAYSEKLSLFLTSIFLLIGNKAIIDDNMPASNVVTLVDKIQLFTFVIATIFITILAITIALDAKGHKKLEYKINHISMYTLIPVYIIVNIYLIQGAM